MAIELLSETPPLLKVGHLVHFGNGWPAAYKEKYFVVLRAQQIEYEAPRILSTGATYDIDFDSPSSGGISVAYASLLPEHESSIYEILIGIKGLCTVFPMYNNSFFNKLEASNAVPDTSDTLKRYVGGFGSLQSPFESPRLREYTVKDVQPAVLRLFNNMPNGERAVLRFIVNRCLVKVKDRVGPEAERAREAVHHSQYTW